MNAENFQYGRSGATLSVSFVSETYPPEINGVALTAGRTVEGLRRRGHRVQIVRPARTDRELRVPARPHDDEIALPGLPLPRYQGLRFGLPAARTLTRLWSANRPDIVHVVTEGPLGWSAVSAAHRLGVAVTSDFHTHFEQYSEHYGIGWMRRPIAAYLRRLHRRTAATFVPTRALARDLGRHGYHGVEVIGRGVDTELFSPERRCPSLRAQWGVDDQGVAVLYVGRIAPEKNLALLLRAFAAIARDRPAAKLVLVGDGPSLTGLRRSHPEHVYAGMRTGQDLARHYACGDIFLFPSLTETFGNVTLEALASGLAVVAFDYAAGAELIRDGHNGLLAPNGDEQAFVAAACRLVRDRAVLGAIRAQARPSVASNDWESVLDAFARSLRRCLAAHRRRMDAEVALLHALD
jgi:glycosyltransferase involved in cell wall biosynthesis